MTKNKQFTTAMGVTQNFYKNGKRKFPTLKGYDVHLVPDCPADTIYFLNSSSMRIEFKKRKNGKPDMCVQENKMIKKIRRSL